MGEVGRAEIGPQPVISVRKSTVHAWLSAHADQPVSVRRTHGVLVDILDLTVDDRAIAVSPARGVTLNTYTSLRDQVLDAVGTMMKRRSSDVVGLPWATVP
ncbi:hypothetical protein [Corynebacterium pseudodiphtheriticum]|uniref:hypothetical protein n=1 Tax=Corynebacterium pseudodiphtheriticum TaxID=37637 RepID=UPI0011D11CE2|nr:hypothetical protein [Corynebacterium pseudodiphtheriticum]MCG7252335.1 hypothetical protein [Corynebacterium pseudodiphtheriticum]